MFIIEQPNTNIYSLYIKEMSAHLERIHKIINKFCGEDKDKLMKYYISKSRDILLDEKEIKGAKLNLLQEMKSMNVDGTDQLLEEVLDHKVLQTRALILDLVDNDYSTGFEMIYKPEKWIEKLVEDIRETFDFSVDFGRMMFISYNKKLLAEFCDIFTSENRKFGSNGNQLLLNFYYYKAFVETKVDFDFDGFFTKMRSHFEKENFKSEEELMEILNMK